MKISLGPILNFRGATTGGWNVSALFATEIVSRPPEVMISDATRQGREHQANGEGLLSVEIFSCRDSQSIPNLFSNMPVKYPVDCRWPRGT